MRVPHCFLIVGLALASSVQPALAQSSQKAAPPARPPAPVTPAAGQAAQPAAAGVLASHETNWPSIVAEITEFRRKGNTLTAQVRFRNIGSKKSDVVVEFDHVYVLDEAGAKKYSVLKDEKGTVIASSGGCCTPNRWTSPLEPGLAAAIWMKFPAPPREVRAVTLQIPNMMLFEDLTIQDQ